MHKVLFAILIMISQVVFAEAGLMTFYGKLLAYDGSSATLQTENSQKVIVPRDSVFPKVEEVVVGKTKVTAKVTFDQFLSFNPKMNELSKKINKKTP